MIRGSASRRKVLKASGVTLATAGLAGCADFLGDDELEGQLEQVEETAVEYDGDPQAAVDDGFTIRGPYAPGGGYTLTHPDRRDSHTSVDNIDLSEPSFLTYDLDQNLGAVGYHGPTEDLGQQPDLFADDENEDVVEQWSDHEPGTHFWASPEDDADPDLDDLFVTDNWAAVHPPAPELEVGDEFEAEWADGTEETRVVDHVVQHPHINSLFVWVGEDNPEGLFAPSNPSFAQE